MDACRFARFTLVAFSAKFIGCLATLRASRDSLEKRARSCHARPMPSIWRNSWRKVKVLELAINSNGRIVVLFADEVTFYRQPELANDYVLKGPTIQPLAHRSHRSNTQGRIGGVVNALSGQVSYVLVSKCGVNQLIELYQQIRADYPEAEVIYLIEDNWPVHFHPTVLNALVEQETGFELKTPRSWEEVVGKDYKKEKLPIQIVPLPTYASWCNPIEKLWRWLKQKVIHLHRKADDWDRLKEEIKEFLNQFKKESAALLQYIGLTKNSKLYGETLALIREKTTNCRI